MQENPKTRFSCPCHRGGAASPGAAGSGFFVLVAMMDYEPREPFYAHRFTRLLFKSCACQNLGHRVVCLLIHVAHTEDAARYSGPVSFWNPQLYETLGCTSPKQLNDARRAAQAAGWLEYERSNDRTVGFYRTVIPPGFEGFDDAPIEENSFSSGGKLSSGGKDSGKDSGKGSGKESGKESGKPSSLSLDPIPDPNPINSSEPPKTAASEPAAGFEPFPCVGKPNQWILTKAKLGEWKSTYEHLDVEGEVKRSRQWLLDNPAKKKTANGMTRYINAWLSKAQDNGRGNSKQGGGRVDPDKFDDELKAAIRRRKQEREQQGRTK